MSGWVPALGTTRVVQDSGSPLFFAGAAGDIVMVMYGPPGGPYELRVIPQFVGLQSEWLRPNVAARPVVPAPANGIVRWWLDGELIGDHTDVP